MGKAPIKKDVVNKIISLRSHGFSINEICKEVLVGKATISKYIQGVKILPAYQKLLKSKHLHQHHFQLNTLHYPTFFENMPQSMG